MKVYFKYKFKLHNEGMLCPYYSERYYDFIIKWKIGRFSLSEVIKFNADIEDEKDKIIILEYLENPNNDNLKSITCEMIQDKIEQIKKEKQQEAEKGYLNFKQRMKLWWISKGFFRWNTFEMDD